MIRQDGYCVTYGLNYASKKVYNGPAKNMSNEEHYDLLKRTCPYLATAGFNKTTSCCDVEQLINLGEKYKYMSALLGACPACLRNSRAMICEITCSPNQSKFYDYKENQEESLPHEMFYVTTSFAENLYKSCRDVLMPGTTDKVIGIICNATSLDKCTVQNILGFILNGRPSLKNLVAINNQTAVNITSNNHHMMPCNESFIEEGTFKKMPACSCFDCRDSSTNTTNTSTRCSSGTRYHNQQLERFSFGQLFSLPKSV